MKKTCLVTGATHGIGKQIALQLLDAGHIVYGCSRGNHTENENFITHENFIHVQSDVSEKNDLYKLYKCVPAIDILVNNAGGGGRWGSDDWIDTEMAVWDEVYAKNVKYIIYLLRKFIPNMILSNWGRVVTISSIYGKENGGRPWYQIAKSAQISLMKSFASNPEYASHNITFNTVCPGQIDIADTYVGSMKINAPEKYTDTLKSLPRRKLGTPEEIANLASFLCSDGASLINGACITADGCESKSF